MANYDQRQFNRIPHELIKPQEDGGLSNRFQGALQLQLFVHNVDHFQGEFSRIEGESSHQQEQNVGENPDQQAENRAPHVLPGDVLRPGGLLDGVVVAKMVQLLNQDHFLCLFS